MTPELHRQFKNSSAYEMLQEPKSMFEKQARVERFDLIQTFHACKQEEGKPVSSYFLKMKGYVEQLEQYQSVVSAYTLIYSQSLNLCYFGFSKGKMELENSQNNSLAKLPILKLGEYEISFWEEMNATKKHKKALLKQSYENSMLQAQNLWTPILQASKAFNTAIAETILMDDLKDGSKWNMALVSMRQGSSIKELEEVVIDEVIPRIKKTQLESSKLFKTRMNARKLGSMAFSDSEVSCSKSCLEEFQQPQIKLDVLKYQVTKPTTVCNKESNNSKENIDDSLTQQPKSVTETSSAVPTLKASENTDAPIIEDWVSDDEEEAESTPKVEKKIPIATKEASVNNDKPSRYASDIGQGEFKLLRLSIWVWRPIKLQWCHHSLNKASQLNEKGNCGYRMLRHMSGNIAHLSEISRNLMEVMYFWWRYKWRKNHCVSQMCDKKNYVLFTDSECLVLSPNFKLPDESQNKPMLEGNGPKWLFDLDSLTQSMNYVPVVAGSSSNVFAGTKEVSESSSPHQQDQDCIIMPIWKDASYFEDYFTQIC
ncbi:hypothetical protein Tco_1499883, partial [Tanacetum coccineum]